MSEESPHSFFIKAVFNLSVDFRSRHLFFAGGSSTFRSNQQFKKSPMSFNTAIIDDQFSWNIGFSPLFGFSLASYFFRGGERYCPALSYHYRMYAALLIPFLLPDYKQ
jgi:hypothetical protein